MDNVALGILNFITQWLWPIVQFLIGLGLVIFVHELGHFVAAKKSGIKVEEFSLGFGKRLFGFRRGETEYRVGLLPLGGYVKMLGQDDFKPETDQQPDPRAWQNTAIYKRLIVLTAGVAMNIVFAAVVFVIVYLIGIRFLAPVVGGVEPGLPAATVELPDEVAQALGQDKAAGLAPGDRILAIDGALARKFEQVFWAGMLSSPEESFRFTIERRIKGKPVVFDVPLTPALLQDSAEGKRYAFGISPPSYPKVTVPAEYGYAGQERFQEGDRIVGAGEVEVENFWDLEPIIKAAGGRPVELVVERAGRRVTVGVDSVLIGKGVKPGQGMAILGMAPRVLVLRVDPGSPADKAGIRAGDVIVGYGDMGAPSHEQLLAINDQVSGEPTPIRVLRAGEVLDLTIVPKVNTVDEDGKEVKRALLGIISSPDQSPAFVADVRKDSPAAKAGIAPGSIVTAVNGQEVGSWGDVYLQLKASAGKEAILSCRHGDDRVMAKVLLSGDVFDPAGYQFVLPAVSQTAWSPLMTPPLRGNPLEALAWSGRDTLDFMVTSYQTLRGLFAGRVSPKSASGPVGIGHAAIQLARRDALHFVYFMGLLSVILAVFNFLPLPALDGGHVLFVLIEKVRGRPLPLKVQAGFQIAGLVLFGLILLAVTWNDILRLLPRW